MGHRELDAEALQGDASRQLNCKIFLIAEYNPPLAISPMSIHSSIPNLLAKQRMLMKLTGHAIEDTF